LAQMLGMNSLVTKSLLKVDVFIFCDESTVNIHALPMLPQTAFKPAEERAYDLPADWHTWK
jgi:hypothetical protein